MSSRSIHVVMNGRISFSVGEKCVCVCAHHIFSTHLSISEHLCCFQVLAIVNSAAINVGLQVSIQIRALLSLR